MLGFYYKKLFDIDIWFSCNLLWPFHLLSLELENSVMVVFSPKHRTNPSSCRQLWRSVPLAVLIHNAWNLLYLLSPISLEMPF